MSSETDINVNGQKTPQQSQQPQQPQQTQQPQQSQQPQQPQQPQQQPSTPFTPPRGSISSPSRLGISLQVPARGSPTTPVLDSTLGYAAVRRPRLDFARACTSLHHSTLAEKSSLDSSPQSGGGASGSSNQQHQQQQNGQNDSSFGHSYIPSSSNATSVDGSNHEDDSSTDEDDELLAEDLMVASTTQTPVASLSSYNLFRNSFSMDSSPTLMSSHQAIQAAVRMRNPKGGLRLRLSRNSSAGPSSPLASPSPITPPSIGGPGGSGYFSKGTPSIIEKRKDSLSQEIRDTFTLHGGMAPGEDELKEQGQESNDPIKRVVSRRGNLLPKTKSFQRIKATLLEESSPLDIEVKREAEVTRQLREDDDAKTIISSSLALDYKSLLPSPTLLPTHLPLNQEAINDTAGEDEPMGGGSEIGLSRKSSIGSRNGGDSTIAFSKRAQMFGMFSFDSPERVNSGSPPRFPPREPLKINSDGDVAMQSDNGSAVSSPVVSTEFKTLKRRRTQEERFEAPNNFKRRAVSPGVCGSPILTATLASNGSGGANGGKRLNFGQGISDTHDGLMKMSLQ